MRGVRTDADKEHSQGRAIASKLLLILLAGMNFCSGHQASDHKTIREQQGTWKCGVFDTPDVLELQLEQLQLLP